MYGTGHRFQQMEQPHIDNKALQKLLKALSGAAVSSTDKAKEDKSEIQEGDNIVFLQVQILRSENPGT